MEDKELALVVEDIEGYYRTTLSGKELRTLKEELKGYDYTRFVSDIKCQLLKKVDYFTIQALHKIVEEAKEIQDLKNRLGIKSFDELYEN